MRSPLIVKCIHNGKYNVFTIADDEYIGPTINAGYEWDGWMRKDLERYYKKGTDIIDIGANIGTCLMEMLLSTKANIVAFEPHPMNVYNIKKTVSNLGKEYQDRIMLFPVGLGSTQSSSTIYSGHDNMGNSQLGTSIQDWDSQEFREHLQFTAFIERLDSILDATKIDSIKFVKMDCQGFECNAVDGMGAVAEKIKYMKFEYAQRFLLAQGCTDIVPRLKKLGFAVFHMGDGTSTQLGEEVFDNPRVTHMYDTPELMAKRPGI
jgi:FkbM family methyltransferase